MEFLDQLKKEKAHLINVIADQIVNKKDEHCERMIRQSERRLWVLDGVLTLGIPYSDLMNTVRVFEDIDMVP